MMKRFPYLMLLLATAFMLTAATPPQEMRPAAEYMILLPEIPTRQESYAAELLTQYWNRVFRMTPPVGSQAQAPFISIGETVAAHDAGLIDPLPLQSYQLTLQDDNLYIRGGAPGPLNGVLALLEEDFGCRWYAEELPTRSVTEAACEFIPDWSGRSPAVIPRSYTPQLEMREMLYHTYLHNSISPQWLLLNRAASVTPHSWLPEESGARETSPFFMHTYINWLSPDHYYDSHPEYYALQNGVRVRMTQSTGSICYTNPAAIQGIVDNILWTIGQNPQWRIYGVSAMDGELVQCECPSCAKLIAAEGVLGAQIFLANQVAEKVVPTLPDIRITALAYNGGPPATLRPHPNVTVFLAPMSARNNPQGNLVPINEAGQVDKNSPQLGRIIEQWRDHGYRLYIWDYADSYGPRPPFPNFDAMAASFRYLAQQGVNGYFADETSADCSLSAMKKWVFHQLLWDPARDLDTLITEFTSAYYGKTAPQMAEYVALQREAWQRFYQRKQAGESIEFGFTDAEVEHMYQLLTQAYETADTPELRGRVGREKLAVLYLFLSRHPMSIGLERYDTLLQEAEALMCHKPDNTYFTDEMQHWQEKFALISRFDTGSGKVFSFKVSPLTSAGFSDLLPDAATASGFAARHKGQKPWGVQYHSNDFTGYMLPDQTYVLALRLRPELKTTRAFELQFNLHKYGSPGQGTVIQVDASNGKTEYRTIYPAQFRMHSSDGKGLFWLDTRVNADEAVWYDDLEFIPLEEFKQRGMAVPSFLIEY